MLVCLVVNLQQDLLSQIFQDRCFVLSKFTILLKQLFQLAEIMTLLLLQLFLGTYLIPVNMY